MQKREVTLYLLKFNLLDAFFFSKSNYSGKILWKEIMGIMITEVSGLCVNC